MTLLELAGLMAGAAFSNFSLRGFPATDYVDVVTRFAIDPPVARPRLGRRQLQRRPESSARWHRTRSVPRPSICSFSTYDGYPHRAGSPELRRAA